MGKIYTCTYILLPNWESCGLQQLKGQLPKHNWAVWQARLVIQFDIHFFIWDLGNCPKRSTLWRASLFSMASLNMEALVERRVAGSALEGQKNGREGK